jgi:hypothetical protein
MAGHQFGRLLQSGEVSGSMNWPDMVTSLNLE